MNPRKKELLERAGWRVGTVAEYLSLTPEESALVEMKVQLSDLLKARRVYLGWSQKELASRIQSSQSRVAKIESLKPDSSVTLDLLFKALLVTGFSTHRVLKILSSTDYAWNMGAIASNTDIVRENFSLSYRRATTARIQDLKDTFEFV